jgi:uncharacterized protein YheU (UPF0270 family)
LTNSTIWLSQIIHHWEDLFEGVEYQDIPIQYVQRMVIYLRNGETIDLHVKEVVQQHGLDYKKMEEALDDKLAKIEDKIKYVDWHIDTSKAADTISKATNQILGDL